MRSSTTEPIGGLALYILILSRLVGIILAATLIPGAVVPLGLNGAMAGVLAAVSLSIYPCTKQASNACTLRSLSQSSSTLQLFSSKYALLSIFPGQ